MSLAIPCTTCCPPVPEAGRDRGDSRRQLSCRPRETKHIDVRLKNLRDHVKRKALELQHIDTKEQIADIFTKGLGREAFDRLSERLMGEPHLHSLRTVAREE